MGTSTRFIRFIAVLVMAFGSARAEAQNAPPAKRPNIIFILADDLGYGDLGCYGQKHIQTPNIDRLAAEGMRFTQHYAGTAVCAPSRCVLLTGLHSGHAFIRDNKELKTEGQLAMPAGTVTVAKLLQDAGYRTACVGKWGLGGPDSTGEPNKMGFDHFFGYLCQREAHRYYPTSLWRNTEKVTIPDNEYGRRGVYAHDAIMAEALGFINDIKPGERFFLYLALTIPHFDLDVPEDSMKPYEGKWEEPKLDMGTYSPQDRPRAAYAGMISRMDRHTGRLMTLLKERGIDRDTLVMFTSDNGATFLKGLDAAFFQSCGPLRGFKGDLYEGGIRVPMIARWPGKIAAGAVNHAPGAFWDVLPTLTELAQVPTPKDADGLSMVPLLLGTGTQAKREFLYWEFPQKLGAQAVRIGDWKGVRLNVKKEPEGPIELYDLAKDIGEKNNVAAEHPDVVARMAEIMRTERTESAEFPLRNVPKEKP